MTSDELANLRRSRWGLPPEVGTLSRARFDGSHGPIHEGADPRLRNSRFAHIMNGSLRDRIQEFDSQQSMIFQPPPRLGGGGQAAVDSNMGMRKSRRDMGRDPRNRGAAQETRKSTAPPLATFDAPRAGSDDLASIAAMFGDTPSRSRGPAMDGPLMSNGERNTEIKLDQSYFAAAPFDPVNQIVGRASRNSGLDYRNMEAMVRERSESDGSRYLSDVNVSRSQELVNQETARTMAEAMVRTVMEEYAERNRGKKFFKEVKTSHKFDNPKAKLVEIDGKYYKMELTPMRVKSSSK